MAQTNESTTTASDAINSRASLDYWNKTSADEDGMLGGIPSLGGGFSSVSRIDLQGSRTFLARLGIGTKRDRRRVCSAVDAGAGIGRITKGLLLDVAREVDVIEPVARFTDALRGHPGVRTIFNVGLEDWRPRPGVAYDIIWTQWCLGHLRDGDVVQYLRACRAVLRPGSGVIVVKENISIGGEDVFDGTDSSVTREDGKFRSLFEEAGLRLVRTEEQRGLPEVPPRRLLPVRMYALKPSGANS
ncbi:hypothetical protein C2857_000120 [Epichloe festucae Fl1]|uniref:Alpha N-terminal protein methyltransferase 1 n=1 Tax=Epichloe festucae (strain Fl1) TaxID=877507 RepID=A0A7S9PV62_EPIFF|nr:hypothetical protein C2857_000120 [Epichloe festucae Fl1]